MNEPLEYDTIYHIYNRGNNCENLFLNSEDYEFFLERYNTYISPIADTYSYSLIPNHFHLMLRINDLDEIIASKSLLPNEKGELDLSKPFSNFFNSYARVFNLKNNRTGKLFSLPFRRKRVEEEDYFRTLVCYIHRNPVHHGLVKDFRSWKYSSYKSIIGNRPTLVNRKEVLQWFGGKKSFIEDNVSNVKNYLFGGDTLF